jgi:hypothetical protein
LSEEATGCGTSVLAPSETQLDQIAHTKKSRVANHRWARQDLLQLKIIISVLAGVIPELVSVNRRAAGYSQSNRVHTMVPTTNSGLL